MLLWNQKVDHNKFCPRCKSKQVLESPNIWNIKQKIDNYTSPVSGFDIELICKICDYRWLEGFA
ncbi:MAG: hypothetical protein A3J50_03075 [Candidatus Woykebacteria bacterium RIFCSPHIGHO2_02_FULL_43_16b]|uniref:Uncharacterized protein n=1 Tax=Candidatus Woykebacteria bacterium RIFCSPHIGHO2_02_FULL_43_16b TaxID=1802601 RepID=A0A1G1WNU6_9BACT|nr:MAG: hypothetical protein A3J50_03075 [Candidatus Woykebacteria bacterium RIFCSPHIGHO2_02_FULL_43_16b]